MEVGDSRLELIGVGGSWWEKGGVESEIEDTKRFGAFLLSLLIFDTFYIDALFLYF